MTDKSGGPAKFDALANKNVVYWARDAIVCMGYTGPAFVGNLPTDSWIVEKLTGLNVSQSFGVRTGSLPQWLDIGQAIKLLERELRTSEIANLKQHNFELVVVGWQWKRGRRGLMRNRPAVPMAWAIHKPWGKAFKAAERLPRDWHWTAGARRFIASPEGKGNLSQSELEALAGRLRQIPLDPQGRVYEQTIVDAIRTVSARNQYVGPNCMSVLLAPPHLSAFVRVRFFPQEHHLARFVEPKFVSPEYPAAYSPWIVGQGIVMQPEVLIGQGWEVEMGPFKILLDGYDTNAISGMSSQRRPLRPIR